MSRRVDMPTDDDVRQAMHEYIDDARDAGTRATVIGLARRLNLSNGTFWRQFPASPPNSSPQPPAHPRPLGRTTAPHFAPTMHAYGVITQHCRPILSSQ